MSRTFGRLIITLLLAAGFSLAGSSEGPPVRRALTTNGSVHVSPRSGQFPPAPFLAPPPQGVTDFSLSELIVHPAGPRGLEFTPRARELDGRSVRVTGFMVRQSQPLPWAFLLSPLPLTLHEREYGLAEDLPPTALHVFYPRQLPPLLPPERGQMVVTGTLRLGNREEADGRISSARLEVSTLHFAGLPTLGVVTPPTNAPAQPLSAASAVSPTKP